MDFETIEENSGKNKRKKMMMIGWRRRVHVEGGRGEGLYFFFKEQCCKLEGVSG